MRFLLGLLISASMILLFSLPGHATCDLSDNGTAVQFLQDCANGGNPENAVSNGGNSGTSGIKDLVQSVAEKVIGFGALFAIGAIVFSGIQYTTSYGDDEKLKHAKSTAIYALIGLLILGVAFPFVDTIVTFIYTIGN